MDNRFQHILLIVKAATVAAFLLTSSAFAEDATNSENQPIQKKATDINNEVFELGVFTGILNVEDFGSQFTYGISATFRASEDFFIQYNYLTADISFSSYERSRDVNLVPGNTRQFTHYDLLVGYNLFQGEFFPSTTKADLSTFYLVAGVGDTEFGRESNMTYTFGVGYQVALTRRIMLHFDFKDYIYKSSLLYEKETSVSATQISSGLKFAF